MNAGIINGHIDKPFELEICFDSGQFAGGAKNPQDECAVVIYPPKTGKRFVNMTKLLAEFWKKFRVTPPTA